MVFVLGNFTGGLYDNEEPGDENELLDWICMIPSPWPYNQVTNHKGILYWSLMTNFAHRQINGILTAYLMVAPTYWQAAFPSMFYNFLI